VCSLSSLQDGSSEDGSAPQQGPEDGVQETGGQSPDGEQDPLIGFSQNFTVVVSKPKANKALQFECLSGMFKSGLGGVDVQGALIRYLCCRYCRFWTRIHQQPDSFR